MQVSVKTTHGFDIHSKLKKINQINNTPNNIWIDSSRAELTVNGSKAKPYQSLTTALNAKLTDSDTTTYIFKLAPGDYVGTVSIDKTTANQSFIIEGSGKDVTFIKGSTNWDSAIGNVLFFKDFNNITIKNCTIQYGAYGFYPRNCKKIILENVKFINNGSVGTVNRHDLTGSKVEQAAYWASNSTNSGGCCRIRSCEEVTIQNCEASYCLRGFRIQDCGTTGKNSIVCNNKVYRTLESGIYLAAGTYNGSSGCENFLIGNNDVREVFNNSILVIGGKKNIVQNNRCIDGGNAGIQCWHTLDATISNNSIYNCNRLSYNGIGNDADARGSLCVEGNTNIGTGNYMAVINNNSTMKCNQGIAGSIIGMNIQPTGASNGAFPSASNKIIDSNNSSDATTIIYNQNNIPVSSVNQTDLNLATLNGIATSVATLATYNGTQDTAIASAALVGANNLTKLNLVTNNELNYLDASSSIQTQLTANALAGSNNLTKLNLVTNNELNYLDATSSIQTQIDNIGGGGDLGASAKVTSTTGNSDFTIESLDPTTGNGKISLKFKMDHANVNNDYQYIFENQSVYDLQMSVIHPNGTKTQQIRLTSAGGVLLGQGIAGFNGHDDIVIKSCRIISDLVFHASHFPDTPASSTAAAETGTFLLDDDNFYYRTASAWKKAPLMDFSYTPPAQVVVRNTVHQNPGTYPSWNLMDDDLTMFIHDTNQSSRQRLPANPTNYQEIILIIANSGGGMNIHTGAEVPANSGIYRTFNTGSVGRASAYQCNLSPPNRYTCIYIETTNQWILS